MFCLPKTAWPPTWLLLCISTVRRIWRSPQGGQPKQRRRKAGQIERHDREGHAVSAGPVKTFRNVGDGKRPPLSCG